MSTRAPLGSLSVAEFPVRHVGQRPGEAPLGGFELVDKVLSLLLDQLPSSTGTVSGPDRRGAYDVTVSWSDSEGADGATQSLSFEIKPII